MNAERWDSCQSPPQMLAALRADGKASDRQIRLFACAVCRLIWNVPNDDRARRAVEVAERDADDVAASGEAARAYLDLTGCLRPLGRRYTPRPPADVLNSAFIAFLRTLREYGHYGDSWEHGSNDPHRCAVEAADRVAQVGAWPDGSVDAIYQAEAEVLRDIFGNPFCPFTVPASLLTSQIVHLANDAYNHRTLDGVLEPARIAALANALQQAGFPLDAVEHLRDEKLRHYRGCHCVDAILRKG